ncbi:MAG: hypothetical protein AVDCRST_MAG29-1972 [uncultured Nocardioidaceae bacterium]|uniref:HTH tetR-type domain-containing protein n=1 Tax=uncultured Nocardioidaceae bacterium TaxID=253824 RepID=A0A6J4M6C8_9ACTN|nr:MAG: hypothetical protein AVDCRST_MAG29-1972 [uncultured Nocardioidaceae bacterium]
MGRQARADETREAVLLAAATAFDQHGYDGTTLSEIVQIFGRSKGALYFHFDSKQEIARAVMAVQADDLPVLASGCAVQDLVDLTMHVGERLLTDVKLRAGVRLAIERASFVAPDASPYGLWIDVARQLLTTARADGELRPHIDPGAHAHLLIGAFTGIQLLSQVYSERTDLKRRLAVLWEALLPGMVVPEVLNRITVERADVRAGEVRSAREGA